jgi:hypothetical protein
MSFRDDHDAALARADALERELEAERAERRRLEALLEERTLSRPSPPPSRRRPPPEPKGITGNQLATLIFVIIAIVLLATGVSSP